MAVQLNHTIVASKDPAASAAWWAELLGLDAPARFGPFWQLTTANGVNIDFGGNVRADSITSQHYAFLITEEEFDAIYGRILDRGLDHFADPGGTRQEQINHNDGGRGVYFSDPDGHWLEVLTRPYGSGA